MRAMRSLMKQASAEVRSPRWFIVACIVGIVLSVMYPTDLESYRGDARTDALPVVAIDDYGRFINTISQIAMPLLLRDGVGLVQLLYVGVSTTVATHGLKRVLDDQYLWGNRLGERPHGTESRHNMPSGHSSMAACAVWFVGRRYGWWHLLYLVPILLLTMFARVALDAHTIPAVIAGALVGLMMAAFFTGVRRKTQPATVQAEAGTGFLRQRDSAGASDRFSRERG